MTAPAFVAQADLENRVGPVTIRQLFDDDNSGTVTAAAIAQCIARANAETIGSLLKKGFSESALTALQADQLLRGIATEIALGYAGERRSEWLNDRGEGRFHALRANARTSLSMIARGQLRIPGEATGPTNQNLGAEIGAPQLPQLPHTFAPSLDDKRRGRPGPGGF